MAFNISIAIHIIAFIIWTGSLLVSSRIIALSAKNNQLASIGAWSKKIVFGWMLPGLVLSVLTGLHQLSVNGFGTYFSQGWFHAKITLVAILIVATVLLVKFIINPQQNSKLPMIIHGVTGACLILIVFLTVIFK